MLEDTRSRLGRWRRSSVTVYFRRSGGAGLGRGAGARTLTRSGEQIRYRNLAFQAAFGCIETALVCCRPMGWTKQGNGLGGEFRTSGGQKLSALRCR